MITLLLFLACEDHVTVASLRTRRGATDTGEPVDTGDTGTDTAEDTGDTAEDTGDTDTATDTGTVDTGDTAEDTGGDTGTVDTGGDTAEDTATEPSWCEANYDKSIPTTYLTVRDGDTVTLEPCGSILHEADCYVASGIVELDADSIDLTDGEVVLTVHTSGLKFDEGGSAYAYCILSTDPTDVRTRSGELYVTVVE